MHHALEQSFLSFIRNTNTPPDLLAVGPIYFKTSILDSTEPHWSFKQDASGNFEIFGCRIIVLPLNWFGYAFKKFSDIDALRNNVYQEGLDMINFDVIARPTPDPRMGNSLRYRALEKDRFTAEVPPDILYGLLATEIDETDLDNRVIDFFKIKSEKEGTFLF